MREWAVPWHAHLLPILLSALMLALWIVPLPGYPAGWMVSWATLIEGELLSLLLHIFAHGGWAHVLMNIAALLLIGGPLISRLGTPPLSLARFLYLFVGSGFSGAALFVLLNQGPTPMLGASGAIFGLIGALARIHPVTGETVAIRSGRSWLLVKFFLQNHLLLLVLIAAFALLSGNAVGLAWEAHLGGLLFGYFASPLYLPGRRSPAGVEQRESNN